MKILFIDDDVEDVELFADVVHEIFPQAECSAVNNCSNIENNMAELGQQDVIFLDAHMAPISGKECLARLRQLVDPQKTRIIILTGSISQLEEHEFLGSGVAAVISKGTSIQEIKSTLYHAIVGNSQQSA